MTEKREATMWNKAASGVGQNGAGQGRGDGRGAGVLSGSVFTRGSFANAFVSFVVAALLMVQGRTASLPARCGRKAFSRRTTLSI